MRVEFFLSDERLTMIAKEDEARDLLSELRKEGVELEIELFSYCG